VVEDMKEEERMQNKEILTDKALDDLGLIKSIDTLSIIYEAQAIKAKKKNLLMNILGFVGAFIIICFNFILLFTIGIKSYLLVQLIVSWMISISFLPILKKKYI
jgi:hypothetical protein